MWVFKANFVFYILEMTGLMGSFSTKFQVFISIFYKTWQGK